MNDKERLVYLTEKLKESGVIDVKFALRDGALCLDTVIKDVNEVLDAILERRYATIASNSSQLKVNKPANCS